MQTKVQNPVVDLTKLRQLTGIEYILSHWQEPVLYVITKQYRKSEVDVVPKVVYYIIDGTIYQSPSAHNVFSARIVQCAYQIRESFKEISQYANFSPLSGYSWKWNEKEKPAITSGPSVVVSHRKQLDESKKLNNAIISVMQKYPPPTLPNEPPLLPPTPIPEIPPVEQTNQPNNTTNNTNTNTITSTTTTSNTTTPTQSSVPTPTTTEPASSSTSTTKRSRNTASGETSKKKSKK
eukprot:TRINITY_DN1916_c0_g1_i1.p1 TRINITY_DN1916_c0_g1~~TRINITY_DN1916_c0_g1_i1.p1  ORF type:complete len:236 (-),score=55.88 TRINITY_DN1916_c0_g1_i1:82-789(-)